MSGTPLLTEFEAVLFDVDGTLIDSLDKIIFGLGDTFEKYIRLRPSYSELKSLIGIPLAEQVQSRSKKTLSAELVDEMIAYTISRYDAHQDRDERFPAALETLAFCKARGLKTALVTSKNALEVDRFFSSFSHRQHVDSVVGASDVSQPKPHPESALLACKRLGVEPANAVFIGDSVYDVRCAKGAGVTAVAVSYGSSTLESLKAEAPDLILHSPDELLEWAQNAFLETPCREKR